VARDAKGNVATSAVVSVTVSNPSDITPPLISNVQAGNITQSGAVATWSTDEPADSQADYGLTVSYGTSSGTNPALVTSHSVMLTGLSPNTLFHYRVSSKDAAGNLRIGNDKTFVTLPAQDTTAPAVSITSPSGGAIVSGSVTVSASASDNVRVAGVQFLLDGQPLGVEDLTAPYATAWNSLQTSSGQHIVSARARDAAGNKAEAAISVVVDNEAPTGSVVINSGAKFTRTRSVTLSLSATDRQSSVTKMRFSSTGTSYSSPQAYNTIQSWTLSSGDGVKTVYVQFQDARGNWSQAFTDMITYDSTKPTQSSIGVTARTDVSATITWVTNEPASSQVEYGPTTSYGHSTPLDTALVTNHSVRLTGLARNTTYYYRVRATDAAGNEAVSSSKKF
jgi:hypothetical protein